jgi:hypothetical protein
LSIPSKEAVNNPPPQVLHIFILTQKRKAKGCKIFGSFLEECSLYLGILKISVADPDPDPDPSIPSPIINSKKNLDSYFFVTSF